MSIGIWQILLIVVLVLLLFGRGKISELMGDIGKGVRILRKGLNEEDAADDTGKSKLEAPRKVTQSDAERVEPAAGEAEKQPVKPTRDTTT